jgi:hypothetical protein
MELDIRAFTYVISLAAIINGLGIVRLLTSFAVFLRRKDSLQVRHYWVYNLLAGFQFLTHVLLWWSMWGVREEAFNLVRYLYLLTGPILLFLGTSVLVPDVDEKTIDARSIYQGFTKFYFSILIFLWIWVILVWPVFKGVVAPTTWLFSILLAIAVVLRFSDNSRVHAALVTANCLVLVVYIVLFGIELGGVGQMLR